jgi:hypothetical protein
MMGESARGRFVGSCAGGGNRVLDIGRGGIDVATEFEFYGDRGLPERAGREEVCKMCAVFL